LAKGDLGRDEVKELYQGSIKVPPYYWPLKPAKGYDEPVLGEGRLRGVWLLPVNKGNEGWSWSGVKKDGKFFEITYDRINGLTHGGDK